MIKTREEKEKVEISTHIEEFYCDNCGVFLSERKDKAYEMGPYADPGRVDIDIFQSNYSDSTPDENNEYTACLCNICRQELIDAVEKVVGQFGFRKIPDMIEEEDE